MKKIVFMLLLVIRVSLTFAQCSCCGSSSGISVGEVTPASFALAKRQWLAELYSDVKFFDPVSNINSVDHHSQTNTTLGIDNMVIGTLGLRYGLNSKTNLSVQQPYVFINGKTTCSKAFGDLLSLINYSAFRKPNFVIGLQAGMEWPIGEYLQESNGVSVSTGSGSFDPVAGLNLIRAFENSSLQASAFFKYTTKGFNNVNYGNFFGHQVSYSYFVFKRIAICKPDSVPKKTNRKLTLGINGQLSGEWLQMQMKQYAIIENTGGYTVLVGLGATVGLKGFTIPVIVSVPVYQYMHGLQNRNTLRLRIGLTKTFN